MKRVLFICTLLLCANVSFGMQAALLISLGMPNQAIKLYLEQSKKYHVPLIIRGLYISKEDKQANKAIGSFRDTAARIKSLEKGVSKSGVLINPILFSGFAIKIVPALVIYNQNDNCLGKGANNKSSSCEENRFDVVYGNVPLGKQLDLIANRSPSTQRAQYARSLLLKADRGINHETS